MRKILSNCPVSCFADEISVSLDRQIQVLNELGIKFQNLIAIKGQKIEHKEKRELNKKRRKDAVQQMHQNRDQFLADMGVGAATGEGYEVTSKTPSALRNTLGLQPGDRILSLNGQGVGQGQNDAQLLEQAKQAGQVKLEIKRGDQVMTIQQNF